jgi:hypothetical protein
MESQPLLSIGIPTHNRSLSLGRAVYSALGQTYPNLELIISDNASGDETESFCRELSRHHGNVRYVRQDRKIGATANFQEILHLAQGDFFMWLGDDDWLDREYAAECIGVLAVQADHSLVCGRERYYWEDGRLPFEAPPLDLLDASATARVLSYYRRVGFNGSFYGIMGRRTLSRLTLQHALGGDWLWVASAAYLGKIRTLESVWIHRSVHGASSDLRSLALEFGLSPKRAEHPHLFIAITVLGEIGWRSPIYSGLRSTERLRLGFASAWAIYSRYCRTQALRRLGSRWRGLQRTLRYLLIGHG